jgi:hypothetical protein
VTTPTPPAKAETRWNTRFRGFQSWLPQEPEVAARLLDAHGPGLVEVRLATWDELRDDPANPSPEADLFILICE